MSIPVKIYTVEEFEQLAALPENADKRLEWIDGVIYEVTSNSESSALGMNIGSYVGFFVLQNNLGRVRGADGGYMVDGERFVPDFSFVSAKRQVKDPRVTYNPICPDFAVEVISPSDLEHPTERIQKKLEAYQRAKIPLLWMVYPERKAIAIYVNGEYVRTAGIDDVLDGGDVLPGFTLPVKQIFGRKMAKDMPLYQSDLYSRV